LLTITLHSRQAIQKYIKANNSLGNVSDVTFKGHVNRAITSGEEKGDFSRPKGMFCTVLPVELLRVYRSLRVCRRVSARSLTL
jgi:hypothetical protein